MLCDIKRVHFNKPQTKTWRHTFFVSLDLNRVKTICWVSQWSFQFSATFLTENKPSNGKHVLFDGDIFMKCFELSSPHPLFFLSSSTSLPRDYWSVTIT